MTVCKHPILCKAVERDSWCSSTVSKAARLDRDHLNNRDPGKNGSALLGAALLGCLRKNWTPSFLPVRRIESSKILSLLRVF